MINRIIPPSEPIRKYVKSFWVVDCHVGPTDRILKLYAGRYPRLTIQCTDNVPNLRYHKGAYLPNSYLTGIKTSPVNLSMSGRYSHLMIIFYPHAIKHIFKIEPSEIINGYFDLISFCPRPLIEMIGETTDFAQRIEIITGFILSRIPNMPSEDPVIQDIILGKHEFTRWSLPDFLKYHKISERQLERKFKSWIGVSPKTFLRIARFEKALHRLKSLQQDKLSSIAFDLGYTDHPHFTRDFRNSAGFTPSEYLATRKMIEHGNTFLQE